MMLIDIRKLNAKKAYQGELHFEYAAPEELIGIPFVKFVGPVKVDFSYELYADDALEVKGKVVYSLNASKRQTTNIEAENTPSAVQEALSPTAEQMKQMNKELERTGVALDTVLSRYHISSVEEMTESMFMNALNSLKKTKKKAA